VLESDRLSLVAGRQISGHVSESAGRSAHQRAARDAFEDGTGPDDGASPLLPSSEFFAGL